MVLRIEDLDPTRCTPEFESNILRDLEWLGLDWDGPVLRQSEQFPRYQEALNTLQSKGLTYACQCTRRDIQLIAAPHRGEDLRYPGTCRELGLRQEQGNSSHGVRLKVDNSPALVSDIIQGEKTFHPAEECGDFLLWTRGGLPSYQFAVTLDDHFQEVTEVVRGRDLMASTARQDLVRSHLRYSRPSSLHLGMVLDARGQRLAKRTGGFTIEGFRSNGGTPEALASWAAKVAGLASQGNAATAREYCEEYALPPKEDWWPSDADQGPFPTEEQRKTS